MTGFVGLGDAANWAQVLSVLVPGTIAVSVWRMKRCRVPWCVRWGQHPVDGTPWKTCTKHLTRAHHVHLLDVLRDRHPKTHAFLNPGSPILPPRG